MYVVAHGEHAKLDINPDEVRDMVISAVKARFPHWDTTTVVTAVSEFPSVRVEFSRETPEPTFQQLGWSPP